MNHLTGKSTGIALLMAAALLAALFAMGVFSAGTVGAHEDADDDDHTHETIASISSLSSEFDAEVKATAALGDADTVQGFVHDVVDGADTTATDLVLESTELAHEIETDVDKDHEYLYLAVNTTALDRNQVTVRVDGKSESPVSPTASSDLGAAGTSFYKINLTDGVVSKVTVTADDADTDVAEAVYTFTLSYTAANTSDTGGGGTAIDLDLVDPGLNVVLEDGDDAQEDATAPQVHLNQNIVIKLPKFTVPSSIDADDISVNTFNPSDVSISGTTLTLRMGNTGTAGTTAPENAAPITTLFIAKRAGILNPAQANDAPDSYPITVESTAGNNAGDKAVGHAIVLRKVSAKPDKGTRGTMTTISGSGLPEGSSTIRITGSERDTRHNISVIAAKDGTFSHEVATDVKDNDGENVFSKGANTINVSDSRGKLVNVTGTFTINPSFTIAPESPIPGQVVTITLSDIAGDVTNASFAGQGIANAFDLDDDVEGLDAKVKKVTTAGKDTYQIKMPSGVRRGTVEMRVTVGTAAPLKKTITIATNVLEVEPDTAVPGQQITITGDGFSANGTIAAADIKIDAKVVSSSDETVDSTGNINFTVNVVEVGDSPRTIKSGTRNVEVTDSSGRVGTAKITVTKAEITLDPAESLIGSTVTVSGIGFPANDLVLIQYDGTTISTSNTDPTGNFSKDVVVPSSADVGDKAKIKAESQVIKGVSDDADHKTPAPALSAETSASGQAGGTVTIGGENFKGFVRVMSIKIGGTPVTPVPAPTTDQWGAFTATGVQVPNLTLGTHPMEITVDEKSVTGFIQIVEAVAAPASTDPADVFAPLGDRLVRVWYLDQDTGNWLFYDPDPDLANFNNLTVLPLQEVVVIIISEGENIDFPATTPAFLQPGTNNRLLN